MTMLDCLRRAGSYWERKRIVYNAVLVVLTLACWGSEMVADGPRAWLGAAIVLTGFAVIANALFCLAYPIDVALQLFSLEEMLKRTRPVLFACGLAIATSLALWILLGSGMA
jgi:hypothetical protein